MTASEWIGISVPSRYNSRVYKKMLIQKGIKDDYKIRGDVYKTIFERLGVKNVVEIRPSKYEYNEAMSVRKAVRKAFGKAAQSGSEKPKPLIIGLDHSAMTYALGDPSVSYLYFDQHIDNLDLKYPNCASFINFIEGRHYIIGASHISETDREAGDKLGVFKGKRSDIRKAKKVLQEKLGNKVFLSIEIDVLRPRFTIAHEFDKNGKMSPKQIKKLSENLLKGRELTGLNVSAYDPCIEYPGDYKTVGVITNLIEPML